MYRRYIVFIGEQTGGEVMSETKSEKSKLVRNAIKCLKCGEIIESKHCHDWVQCGCGACFVDGGLDYMRVGGNRSDWEDLSEWE